MPVEDGASDIECQRLDLRHHAGGWGLPSLGGWQRWNLGIFVLDTDGLITHKQFHESYRVRDTGAGTLAQPTSCRTVTIPRSGGNDDGLPSRARLAEIDHPPYWVPAAEHRENACLLLARSVRNPSVEAARASSPPSFAMADPWR
jgi:hypothetical protein